MRTTILITTACLALMSGSAPAQTTTTPAAPADTTASPADNSAPAVTKELFKAPAGTQALTEVQPISSVTEGQVLASEFIGKSVYSGDGDDAQSIGELNDLIITPEGMVHAAVIGVGGFLGVGEKDVAIPASHLKLSVRSDKSNWIVVNTAKEDLQSAPAFEVSEKFTEGVADPNKANEAKTDAAPAETIPAVQDNKMAPATPAPAN
ncbi:PRC-barrel domain-containing protein [Candidatus Phyllobacterium onerii]|uniref:PRC-barrel domain-containing protein n=1 Tax=Candidatus Phyllobacterium onerii TaxID=3020828 RepID=UPI00232D589E|nr:PRC-barrel domain-containing protein [Phyllobacterium sp. IY22]